ncbi:glycosyltransferase family 9 protein [Aquimarina intermedia]|uniref:ADP-heptose:LPS heptosyltransferase n=1 Tax=Aquimarina intermedia TaxID=350814 RepID=A0A5S5CE83_9FLAO|nr:glycosyltransferase family 9 protein [Aquimarina intermedia]TYP76323.1 ADP-heptose:LPS heptosyltransferase [Aquimarina intermedia]
MAKNKTEMLAHTKHLLIIRLSAMGDVAMTVPVLRTVCAKYPQLKITVLTRAFFAPLFNDIDNVQVYPADVEGAHKGALGLFKLSKELKRLRIDAVADLHNVLRSNILKSFFRISGIPVVQINKGREEKKALTRASNKIFKQLKSTHQRYADVFENLGFPIDLSTHSFPEKPALTPEINTVIPTSSKKWLGIAPFAQYESKTYPFESIVKVIDSLNSSDRFDIFLFGGGKKEKDILNVIASKYNNTVIIAGRLSFENELRLIANLDGMLAMDSGNAHLAAMYGIPTLTIWGVTHPFTGFAPFGQPMEHALLPDVSRYDKIPTSIYGNKVPQGYENVMQTIHPKDVVDRIMKYI